ncbi:MAG: hypothetical protein KF734_21030 [Saprospiraceae bacterium]|nr:hypothetical protein [Saprospiraceae bacterium]
MPRNSNLAFAYNSHQGNLPESYFWSTYYQQEFDLVEVRERQIVAFECRWKETAVKVPHAFEEAHPDAVSHTAHPRHYEECVSNL